MVLLPWMTERKNITNIQFMTTHFSKNGVYFKGKKTGNYYSMKHNDRIVGKEFERLINTPELEHANLDVVIEKMNELSKLKTKSLILSHKTENNLTWNGKAWVTDKEVIKNPQNSMTGKVQERTDWVKYHWEKERYGGRTMSEIKNIARTKIEKAPHITNPKTLLKKVEEAKTEKDISFILKENSLTQIFRSNSKSEAHKWVAKNRARDKNDFETTFTGKRLFTEYMFSVTDEVMREMGYYEPQWFLPMADVTSNVTLRGRDQNPAQYGVDYIDREKFMELGKTYINTVEKYITKKVGKLPNGQKHVVAAVWHFDEKTPHLHLITSNIKREKVPNQERYKIKMAANEIHPYHGADKEVFRFREIVRMNVNRNHEFNLEKDAPMRSRPKETEYEHIQTARELLDVPQYLSEFTKNLDREIQQAQDQIFSMQKDQDIRKVFASMARKINRDKGADVTKELIKLKEAGFSDTQLKEIKRDMQWKVQEKEMEREWER